MPRKKKKSREQVTAENYFPVDVTDIKYSIEKPVKSTIMGQSVDPNDTPHKMVTKGKKFSYNGNKKTTRKFKKISFSSKKGSSRFTSLKTNNLIEKIKEYAPQEVKLKKTGYELIITEKPQAALKIASALDNGKNPAKKANNGIPYYELTKNGKEIVVACAVGHLFTLKQETGNGQTLPVFEIKWVPNFLARNGKTDFTKKYYDTISKLVKNASSITIATDYDIEGEVIGLNVVRFICGQKDASRMKFSTLTDKELNEAYETKSQTLNWGQAIAGETRHYLDWYYGINLSRALMNAIKTIGRFKIMSIGRVQGPALNLIVEKERKIQGFKPSTYWQIFIKIKNSHVIELKYNKDITKKSDLKKFEELAGEIAIAETKKTQEIIPPPVPFNLTTLQTEAYKLFGITPSRTLQIAQSLYLNGLISYPRTSSEKLPASINYLDILDKLNKKYKTGNLTVRNKPIEGKKSDPAHPSIYPTSQEGIINAEEEKIYNLIVKRFLSLFCEDAIIENKIIKATYKDFVFIERGVEIKKKAWMEIYPVKLQEKEIPDINGEVKIINVRTEEKETQPPKRYSPASILSELEKRNLGTKATRASILETLYDRDYVRDKSIEATQLGMHLIETLEKYSPVIIDEALTRHFEREMEAILGSKKNMAEKQKNIIDEAKETIKKILEYFDKNGEKIGKELVEATDTIIEQQKKENTLTFCPVCKKGNLRIIYNRQAKRYFVGCSSYPECKTTFTLPPNSLIKTANKTCEHCNFPMVISLRKGKKPWTFCFNLNCESNRERIEAYKDRKA